MKLYGFLRTQRIGPNNSAPMTHLSIGGRGYGGKFSIPSTDYVLFRSLYATSYLNNENIYLVERKTEIYNFFVDIDFDSDQSMPFDYITLLDIYQNAINTVLDTSLVKHKAILSTRLRYKIHINYPGLYVNDLQSRQIRNHVILILIQKYPQLSLKQWCKIVDISIYKGNGLRMLGSIKQNEKVGEGYQITDPVSGNRRKEITIADLEKTSIQTFNQKQINFRKDYQSIDDPEVSVKAGTGAGDRRNKKGMGKGREVKETKVEGNENGDNNLLLNLVKTLLANLPNFYCENYQEWLKIGAIIYNEVGGNIRGLQEWKLWSSQSPKYQESECDRHWNNTFSIYRGEKAMLPTLIMEQSCMHLKSYLKHQYNKIKNKNSDNDNDNDDLENRLEECVVQNDDCLINLFYEINKDIIRTTSSILGIRGLYQYHNGYWSNQVSLIARRIIEFTDLFKTLLHNETSNAEKNIEKIKGVKGIITKLGKRQFKNAIYISVAELSNYDYPNFLRDLDNKRGVIGFNNGVYDLELGGFREIRADDYLTYSTNYTYLSPDKIDQSINDQVHRFLIQIMPDPVNRKFLIRYIASLLYGENKDHIMAIWTGVGSNGKSMLVKLIQETFGDYFDILPSVLLTQEKRQSNQATPELVSAMRKRVCCIQEPDGNHIKTGKIKELTGSDHISFRGLYQSKQEKYVPQFGLILCCNQIPTIKDNDDDGIWRRIRVMNFKTKFVDNPDPNNPREMRKDVNLSSTIKTWKQAFMNILLEEYKKYKEEGLATPDAISNATQDFRESNDPIIIYATEKLRMKTDSYIQARDLNQNYRDWYKDRYGRKCILKNLDIRKSMEAKVFKVAKYHFKVQGDDIYGWKDWEFIVD